MEAIETIAVNDHWEHISGTEEIIPCDTLLLSVGLIPENELSRQAGVMLDPVTGGPIVDSYFHTNIKGIFAAGNVVHVYDLVDWVTKAGYSAGKGAALYAQRKFEISGHFIQSSAGKNVRYVVPQKIDPRALSDETIPLQMRVIRPIEAPVWVEAVVNGERLTRRSLPYARPGEMITLNLKPDLAYKIKAASEIKINIIER